LWGWSGGGRERRGRLTVVLFGIYDGALKLKGKVDYLLVVGWGLLEECGMASGGFVFE